MAEERRFEHRIGVLVPFTNTNLEGDCFLLQPENTSFHFARLGGYDLEAIPDSSQMSGLGKSDLEEPLRMIAGVKPDLVIYGCTSATLSIGPEFDRKLALDIEKTIGAKTVTAASALVHAINTLNAKRIAFASPYVKALNDDAISFLASQGFQIVSRKDFPEALDNFAQGALTPETVFELGLEANSDEAEVLVLSCTDMRAVEVISRLEKEINKPVITSNQAMMFKALQLLGIQSFKPGFGCLFDQL